MSELPIEAYSWTNTLLVELERVVARQKSLQASCYLIFFHVLVAGIFASLLEEEKKLVDRIT